MVTTLAESENNKRVPHRTISARGIPPSPLVVAHELDDAALVSIAPGGYLQYCRYQPVATC